MVTVSVCMIVKDEERVLERSLSCAARFADEIVVVDTGSRDTTKEIARRFTPHVYDFAWRDDFSAARNCAFDHGSGDYLMWLDADDVLDEENIGKLLELKAHLDPSVDVVMMRYETAFDAADRATFHYQRERLVRRAAGLRWQDPVHEFIAPTGRLLEADIAIQHRPPAKETPSTRNLEIYEGLLARGETLSTRGLYYYARELKTHGRFLDAIARFSAFLRRDDAWVEDAIRACTDLYDCYIGLNRPLEALEALCAAFARDLPRPETACRAGAHYLHRGQDREAIFWYELALTLPQAGGWGFTESDYADFIPHLQLCVLYDRAGQRELARRHHDATRALKPEDSRVQHNERYFAALAEQSD